MTLRRTEVGRTGARFGSAGLPKSDPAGAPRDPDPAAAPAGSAPDATTGRTGARFGPHSTRARGKDELPDPRVVRAPDPGPARTAGRPRAERLPIESEVLTRPYTRTRGRTHPTGHLAIEALISTSPNGSRAPGRPLPWEHRMIANLCARPHSVAEVAALLSIPLGVARVLLVDMAADGTVVVHGDTGNPVPDLVLMRRVLAGLRQL
jgi:hypothetical protein